MRHLKLMVSTSIALLATLALAVIGTTSTALAAPSPSGYPPGAPGITVSDTTPAPGQAITIVGRGFLPHETVVVALHSTTFEMGSPTANGGGVVSLRASIPTTLSGEHLLTLTGLTSGVVDSIMLDITGQHGHGRTVAAQFAGGSGTDGTSSGSSGMLSSTGVAVLGIGGLGLILLAGGGGLLLAGRARRTADSD